MMEMIDSDAAPAMLQSCIPVMTSGLFVAFDCPKSTFGLFDESAIEPAATMRYIIAKTIPCNVLLFQKKYND